MFQYMRFASQRDNRRRARLPVRRALHPRSAALCSCPDLRSGSLGPIGPTRPMTSFRRPVGVDQRIATQIGRFLQNARVPRACLGCRQEISRQRTAAPRPRLDRSRNRSESRGQHAHDRSRPVPRKHAIEHPVREIARGSDAGAVRAIPRQGMAQRSPSESAARGCHRFDRLRQSLEAIPQGT